MPNKFLEKLLIIWTIFLISRMTFSDHISTGNILVSELIIVYLLSIHWLDLCFLKAVLIKNFSHERLFSSLQLIKIKHCKEVQAVISKETINSLNHWTLKLHISSYTVYAISAWKNMFKFKFPFISALSSMLILVSKAIATTHSVYSLTSVFCFPELQDQNFRSISLLCVEVGDILLNRECYYLFSLQLKTITRFLHWI